MSDRPQVERRPPFVTLSAQQQYEPTHVRRDNRKPVNADGADLQPAKTDPGFREETVCSRTSDGHRCCQPPHHVSLTSSPTSAFPCEAGCRRREDGWLSSVVGFLALAT